ncbi:2'-5' RNA ligase family protein [Azospirillum sp. SYSU D00513]|uniref:2'-5' RNA ligase family protein n=1 Tax=Azospirillum sp. SYSU D00513 TaxID=2812561 RepID=UPI001A977CD3|nr:2'-5' RNA ligase family protein [Azospirillum sp. SYSU D00513]
MERGEGGAEPLIVTLRMDEGSFRRLDGLRRAEFPTERNHIPAHLTLFHKLPGEEREAIADRLTELARGQTPIRLRATGLLFLGRGVAFSFEAPELVRLRKRLAWEWSGWLSPQDRQGFRPHVTIQNKVPPDRARALHERLQAGFEPFEVLGEGLLLWRYLGGPWQAAGDFPFSAADSALAGG